jgi:hypothetical protein
MGVRERNPASGPEAPTDTITRLQQERDHLQRLRQQRELHDFYLTKIKQCVTDSSYQASNFLRVSDNLDRTLKQLEWYRSAHDTQKLLI